MKVTEHSGVSGRQVFLHFALQNAVDEYERVYAEVQKHPEMTEENSTPQLTLLYYQWEQWRVTALILAAACVEAAMNVYLAFKDPDHFDALQWKPFMKKVTSVPKQFVEAYNLPEDGELYRDLTRLHERRNALMHMKEDVSYEGKVVKGEPTGHSSMDDEHEFVKRSRSIVDRLVAHLQQFDPSEAVFNMSVMAGFASVYLTTMKNFEAAQAQVSGEPPSVERS